MTVVFSGNSSVLGSRITNVNTRPMSVLKQVQVEAKHNLMTGEAEYIQQNDTDPIQHWTPMIEINVVVDVNKYPQFPPQFGEVKTLQGSYYYPVVDVSSFWTLHKNLIPVNDTVSELPLEIYINPQWVYKYLLIRQFDMGNKVNQDYGL